MRIFLQFYLIAVFFSGCTTIDRDSLRLDGAGLTRREACQIAQAAGEQYGFRYSVQSYLPPTVDYFVGERMWYVHFQHRKVMAKYDFSVQVNDITGRFHSISYEIDPTVTYGATAPGSLP